jgi:hypothetical protein
MIGLGKQQVVILTLAAQMETRGKVVSIADLAGVFMDWDGERENNGAATRKSELFQARRAVKALVARGLMEPAGTVESRSGDPDFFNTFFAVSMPGCRVRKGYARVTRAYRLTAAGRAIGAPI